MDEQQLTLTESAKLLPSSYLTFCHVCLGSTAPCCSYAQCKRASVRLGFAFAAAEAGGGSCKVSVQRLAGVDYAGLACSRPPPGSRLGCGGGAAEAPSPPPGKGGQRRGSSLAGQRVPGQQQVWVDGSRRSRGIRAGRRRGKETPRRGSRRLPRSPGRAVGLKAFLPCSCRRAPSKQALWFWKEEGGPRATSCIEELCRKSRVGNSKAPTQFCRPENTRCAPALALPRVPGKSAHLEYCQFGPGGGARKK